MMNRSFIDNLLTSLCDEVIQVHDTHGEIATFGDQIVAIKAGGSSKGLAKLAIATDLAKICDSVLRSLATRPLIYDTLAFPVFQRSANLLAKSGREEYRKFSHVGPRDIDRFLTVFRRDAGWFGIACAETTWSGLEICRRCAVLDPSCATLNKYKDISNVLIDSLLGSSPPPLATRAFFTFLDEIIAESVNDDFSSGVCLDDESTNQDVPSVTQQDPDSNGRTKDICVEWAGTRRNVRVTQEAISIPTIFNVHESPGLINIVLNSKHPLAEGLYDALHDSNGHENGNASPTAIYVLLESWARLEQLSGEKRRQMLEDIRLDWGRVARDILSEEEQLSISPKEPSADRSVISILETAIAE